MLKDMIYHLRICSPESVQFSLELEVSGEHSFFELHTLIQKSLGYESHQLASFFILGRDGRKQTEVSLLDYGLNVGAFFNMQRTKISDLLESNFQQILYTYDFMNDRSFYIELTETAMEKNLSEPYVTSKQGDVPVQVLDELSVVQESIHLQEEEVLMDFGILDDYSELYGEMEDF